MTASIPVNVKNFIRAETDLYFGRTVKGGASATEPPPSAGVDRRSERRANEPRHALFVRCLRSGRRAGHGHTARPGKRFMSMQVVSQDHYAIEVVYGAGDATPTRRRRSARATSSSSSGRWRIPGTPTISRRRNAFRSDQVEQGKPASSRRRTGTRSRRRRCATRSQRSGRSAHDHHVRQEGRGRSGQPPDRHGDRVGRQSALAAGLYRACYPTSERRQDRAPLTVKDVPVDGFWSISVYNAKGYFEKNELERLLAEQPHREAEPGRVVHRSGSAAVSKKRRTASRSCPAGTTRCACIGHERRSCDGTWKFPEAQPVK